MPGVDRDIQFVLVGLGVIAVAFLLRIGVHAGRTPSGVDTWYYLAYADAFRRRPGFSVYLPQYLLQDVKQSYAPLFPSALALIPGRVLRRWFWVISPAIDCLHLAMLYWLAYRITGSIAAAGMAGAIYAFTPQLVSETRSLNGRSFGALLHSIALVLLLRLTGGGELWPWLILSVVAGAAVFLTSATSSAAYVIVSVALTLIFGDPTYALVALGSVGCAVILSGGHFVSVVRNYLFAVRYWYRNRRQFGAHPIQDSPIYGNGTSEDRRPRLHQGFLGGNTAQQLLRLLGENPFILALPLAPYAAAPWGAKLYWWAIVLAGLSLFATVLPPLRILGPGRSYMKAAVFPTAYTLAIGIDGLYGLTRPVGIATLIGLLLSIVAIAYFYRYTARRRTEHTASAPQGLIRAVKHLSTLPGDGVLCFPYMYADYTCYNSGKSILWGGHSGDLTKFEALAPVISRPLPDLMREYGVSYVLLDTLYAKPEELRLTENLADQGRWDSFMLFEWCPSDGGPRPVDTEEQRTRAGGVNAD